MSKVFPPNSRAMFLRGLLVVGIGAGSVLALVGFYVNPKWSRVGYAPVQPVSFDHSLHVGRVGLDCTYCHSHVFEAASANVPAVETCMRCHDPQKGNIQSTSPALAPIREAWATGNPVPWVRVHHLPDYVYFNHAVHVNRGISCVSCHGKVNEMEVVRHDQPLSMGWCLECHRHPEENLRPKDQVTNLNWKPEGDSTLNGQTQSQFADWLKTNAKINPPQNCTTCHR